jgi:LPXTG-motif cell wall-anchored protein
MTKVRAAAVAALILCAIAVPSAAMANDYTSPNTALVTTPPTTAAPVVLGNRITAPTTVTPAVVVGTTTGAPAKSSSLPFTGADIASMVLVGLVLVGGGALLVRRNRARSPVR